jgi:RHS repeat-associated protein
VGGLLAITSGSTSQLPFCDGNGNIVGTIDAATGQRTAEYEYGPFGELLRATGPMASANPFRFSTHYTDQETGLVYAKRRYYQPATGRWLSRDPIGEQGGANLFAYVLNSPVRFFDPFGLKLTEYTTDTSSLPLSPGTPKPGFAGQANAKWTSSIAKVKGCWGRHCVEIKGRLTIDLIYDANVVSDPYTAPASGGGTLADHERGHAAIYKKWWNELKAQADPFELSWCEKKCAGAAAAYANAATAYYFAVAHLESAQYDQQRYPAQGQSFIQNIVAARQGALNNAKSAHDKAQKAWEETKCSKK